MQTAVSAHQAREVCCWYVDAAYYTSCVADRVKLLVLNPITNAASQGLAIRHSTLHTKPLDDRPQRLSSSLPADEGQNEEQMRSVVPSPVDEDEGEDAPASLRVGLLVHKGSAGYAARANNLHAYLELNRHVRIHRHSLSRSDGPPSSCRRPHIRYPATPRTECSLTTRRRYHPTQ